MLRLLRRRRVGQYQPIGMATGNVLRGGPVPCAGSFFLAEQDICAGDMLELNLRNGHSVRRMRSPKR